MARVGSDSGPEAARLEAAPVGVASISRSWVGDLLLQFGTAAGDASVERGAGGWVLREEPGWTLSARAPGECWAGYPLLSVTDGPRTFWLLGELYDAPAHDEALRQRLRAVHDGTAASLNGHYLLLAWDGETRQWHAWTSRFGTLHAYIARSNGRTALGTFFPAVAGAASRKELDWIGLATLFGFGFFLDNRTFFDDTCILRPASHYVWDQEGRPLRDGRYWDWSHPVDERRSYDDAVGEFGDRMREVMRDLTAGGRVAVPISGGLDSRTTVAFLDGGSPAASARRDGRQLWGYSYGYTPNSIETHLAGKIAAARHLPFTSLTVAPYLFDELEVVLNSVEGFQDLTLCRQAAVRKKLAADADYVIAAHWGDVWLDDMGLSLDDAPARVEEKAFKKMAKRGRAWLLGTLCAGRLGERDPEGLLRELLRERLAQYAHLEDPDFRLKAFKTDHWSFRWTTASLRMYQAAAFPRLPFYDLRIADLCRTLPSSFVRGRRLQQDALRRFAPDLARIPWQATDQPLSPRAFDPALAVVKRAGRKLWRTIRRERPVQRNWEVQFLGEEGRSRLAAMLLAPDRRIHQHLGADPIAGLLREFEAAPTAENGYAVGALVTFAAWLEHHA